MTDTARDLIQRLADLADALDSGTALASNQGQAMDGYSALAAFRDVANRARAELAKPEVEGTIKWPAYFVRQAAVQEQELKAALAEPEPKKLLYSKGDLIRLTVPTVSGWQGIGVVLEPVYQDAAPNTVVFFRRQGEDDDAIRRGALLSEIEPAAQHHPKPQRRCLYSPTQIAECGGPCQQGPEHCDCGELCVTEPASEPEEPTDEELRELWNEGWDTSEEHGAFKFARAVLARWGSHVLQPIPVSERMPEPEDCNDEGEVWAWRRFSRFSLEKDIDNSDFWCLAYHKWLEGEDCGFTHWLPAHALPLPTHD